MDLTTDDSSLLVDPGAYADGRIFDLYRRLRAEPGLVRARPDGFRPFWVVTRHADLKNVGKRYEDFANGRLSSALMDSESEQRLGRVAQTADNPIRTLLSMDGREHRQYRALAQSWFMPGALKPVEAIARSAGAEMLASLPRDGSVFDFATIFAQRVPLHVIMQILGVPASDEDRMNRLTQELFGTADPDTRRRGDADSYAAAIRAIVSDFGEYFEKISAARRAVPTSDLATVIANAQIDGGPIPSREALSYYILVSTAGHDTTAATIAGGVEVLARDSRLWRELQSDRNLLPAFVDEALRWTSPVKTFMRTATRDVDFGDATIAEGDWLMLCYASANRDEAVFEHPDVFSLSRGKNEHLAFGFGAHACLGQFLAKLELRVIFDLLLDSFDTIELAGEPENVRSYFVSGHKKLPVSVRWRG